MSNSVSNDIMGKFLSDTQYAFTLEPYVNGTPDSSLVTKEVDMVVATPFLLTNPDFSKTEVVKAYTHHIVVTSMDYWKQTIKGKKGDQLERMKAVRIFNPMHVLGNMLTPSSHSRKGRIARGRTHLTYLIGGSQTVQHCQDSRE